MKLAHILCLFTFLFLIGCSAVEFKENYSSPIPTKIDGSGYSADQIKKAIKIACAERGWIPNFKKDNSVIATLNIREHYAQVKLTYTENDLNIRYMDSKNLGKNGVGNNIHKNYERWVNNLLHSIVVSLNKME